MRHLLGFLLAALACVPASAGYFQQASIPVAAGAVYGMDRDALGNLYVLGLPAGSTYYQVSGFQTPGMTPLFSFETGVSSPVAFAVENSGIVDILDASTVAVTLRRFDNAGAFLGEASYPLATAYETNALLSAGLDKANGMVYIAYQKWANYFCLACVGCSCPPSAWVGVVLQYDFSGTLLRFVEMPGKSSSAGSCYTPSQMAADPQGSLYVADNACQHVLKFSMTGTLVNDFPASGWSASYFTARGLWSDPASRLYISQPVCGANGCQNGVVKLDGAANVVTTVAGDSPRGCAWDERVLYLSSAGQAPIRRWVDNAVPTVPSETAPIGPVVQHSSAAALAWQHANDPDGDEVRYFVGLGTSPTRLAPIGDTSLQSLSTQPLPFETTYYWQVTAEDSYAGLPLQRQPAPVVSFRLSLQNAAPGAFNVLTGTGTTVTRDTSVRLAWSASNDPDGDPVAYDVTWRAAGQSAPATNTTETPSLTMSGLAFGTTYLWAVRARDVYGVGTALTGPAEQSTVAAFRNSPPETPAYLASPSDYQLHTASPTATLAWAASLDPDGDDVAYRFALSAGGAAWSVELATATSITVPAVFETTYSWRVSAFDSYGAASTGPWRTFIMHLANQAPAPVLYTSADKLVTRATSYALSWQDTGDPDGDAYSYSLFLSTDPGGLALVQTGLRTSFPLSFQFGTTYYWQVRAVDSFGARSEGALRTFRAEFKNTAPTAPGAITGTGLISTRNNSQVLSWSASYDADGDPVTYELAFSTQPAVLPEIQASTATTYSLAFQYGTTYYWQATARDGFGGVSTTGVQSFLPVFRNSAPSVPTNLSKTGTISYHGWSPSQSLFWQEAADPDGDAFTYSIYFGTDSERLSLVAPASLGQTFPNLAINTAYYYRIVATDRFGAVSVSPLNWVYYQFSNAAPRAFDPIGPAGTVVTRNGDQSLSWTASSDPDGDLVTYRVHTGTSATSLSPMTDTTQTSVQWTGLAFGATYFWRIDAYDGFGGTMAASGGTQSFHLAFRNAPPAAPGYSGALTAHDFHTQTPEVALSWTPSSDPDGDVVSYRLELGLSTTSWQAYALEDSTSFTVAPAFGTTYYWRVTATDPNGGATQGPWASFIARFVNRPPATPAVLSGAGVSRQHTLSPTATFSWSAAADPDGDATLYRLAVGGTPQSLAVVLDGPATFYALPAPQLGTTYYWQVSAYDPYGGLAATPVQSLLVELQNAAPLAPSPLTGTGVLSTRDTNQLLSWSAANDPDSDPVTYEFALSTDAAALPVVQASTATSFLLAFQYGTTYYWQATARDGFGGVSATDAQTFLPVFRNSAPSAPTNLSKTGTILHHGWAPSQSLFWQDAADPDGDAFTYSVYFGTDSEHLALVAPASLGQTYSNLAVNTAYYYRIVATDIHGAASASPLNWVYYQFSNAAPRAFDPIGPAGTVVTRNGDQSLSWTSSGDADGDLVTYRVYAGTAPGALAPLGDTTQTAALWRNLPFGATYYWRVEAFDGFGGTTPASGGTQRFYLAFRNSPPGPLVYFSTASAYNLHTSSPAVTLAWGNSLDPDGDPVSYRLDVRTSTGDSPGIELGGAASFTLEPQFETTYSWRVTASDPFGGVATGPWASFAAHFVNQPPRDIVYTSTPALVTRATSHAFSWRDTGDPDGDAYAYSLFLATEPSRLALAQQGSQTSFDLAFQFGATYYWQVSAKDSFGAVTAGPVQTFLPIFKNAAPTLPAATGGAGTLPQHALSPQATLSWSAVTDPDADPVAYQLFLGTAPTEMPLVQNGPATSYGVPSPQFGTTYYWRVSASDPYGGLTTTPSQTLLLQLANVAPSAPQPRTGTGSLATRETTQLFSWAPSFDADGDLVTYELALSTTPGALALAQSSTATSFPLSFQFGTTYYWQVMGRDAYGGAADSGLQTFAPSFRNAAPTTPANLSRTGTIPHHGYSPSLSFFWQDSTDTDGDSFAYALYFGTDPAKLTRVSPFSLGHTIANLSTNTAYYYRIIATDIYGASSESPVNWVYFQFFNNAPRAFDPIGPSGSVVTRDANQTLSWAASSDPDGDLLTYRVQAGTSPTSLAPLADTTQSSALWPNLPFGATYYWRVEAYDTFAATTAASGGTQSFGFMFRNAVPAAPGYTGTAAVQEFHTLFPSVDLAWSAATDPDGDPVTYRLDLGLSTGAAQAYSLGASTAFNLKPLFETTYYWRVTAADPYGGGTAGPWASVLARFVNRAPAVPAVLAGSGVSRQHTQTPTGSLSWSAAADPDGDPTAYRLALGSTPQSLAVVQDGPLTSYALPSPRLGTTYYWQVSAYDPYGGATSTPVQALLFELQNSVPAAPEPLTGSGALSTRGTSQLLSWSAVADPDGDSVTYEFALSTDAAALPVVQASSATSFMLAFQYGTTYYWQAMARDSFGAASATVVQVFQPEFRNSAPSVPANLSKSGTIPYHGWAPGLSVFWQDAADADGDAFTYSVQFGTDSERLSSLSPATLGHTFTNLAVNTAYYYRIVATDIHGAASASPLNWVYYQFTNGAPQAFDPIGPVGTVVSRDANQTLSWTGSSDPDGDLVTYRVSVGTVPGVVSTLTETTQTSAPWPGLPFGGTYYWRVDAYDALEATTPVSGGVQSFTLTFRNSAPSAPLYTSTAAVREIHTLTPELTLSWAPAGDADGDAVRYRLDLGLSTSSWQSYALTDAMAFAFAPLFDTTYYWRVSAADPYGGVTAAPWASVVARFANRAPALPAVLSGAGVSRQHTLRPAATLSWTAAADAEGDAVFYQLRLGTSPTALAPVQEGAGRDYALPSPSFGTTYYWQVSAIDSFGGASTTPVQSLTLWLDNTAPAAFEPLTGMGALATRQTSQLLSWETSRDTDGDPLIYGLYLSSGSGASGLVQTSTATSFLLAFQYGTTYYWRAEAYDGFGGTTTAGGGAQAFYPTFLNDPPAPLKLSTPFKASPVVSTMHDRVALSWERVTTPQGDPVTYTVYLGDSPNSLRVLTRISQEQAPAGFTVLDAPSLARPQSQVELDGDTLRLTLTGLDYYHPYYFRIEASNPYGATTQTALETFSLSAANGFPKAYNYPNPFSPARGGTRIVFNAPPSGYAKATVSIYSELQDLLFRREYANIPPGISEEAFDGRDRYGRSLFNGSYIGHVRFEGPDDKETFYLMVVR